MTDFFDVTTWEKRAAYCEERARKAEPKDVGYWQALARSARVTVAKLQQRSQTQT